MWLLHQLKQTVLKIKDVYLYMFCLCDNTYCFVEVGVVRGNVNVKVGVCEDGCGIGT